MNPEKLVDGKLPAELAICIDNGDAGIVNVDGPGGYKNISTDIEQHRCELPRLPTVELRAALAEVGEDA